MPTHAATPTRRGRFERAGAASILDPEPKAVRDDVAAIAIAAQDVPTKQLGRNLLIGTWNLREFGDLADVWDQPGGRKPKRDLHALRLIAEIVSRFDVVAIQEVQSNLKALRHMLKWLGPNWSLILTDVTKGQASGGERLAFVFDTRRVKLSGLASEIVIPPEELAKARASKDPAVLSDQFARTPYAVAFQTQGVTFVLVTVHIVFGKSKKQRTPEIAALAHWLKSWADDLDEYGQNLIALGDFNIDRREKDANYAALVETGLTTPPELDDIARTISAEGDAGTFYDQVAWFDDDLASLRYTGRAGRVDWKSAGILAKLERPSELSFRMSDHYPLWTEFAVGDLAPT